MVLFDRVPEFWRWLLHHANAGNVKIPPEIYVEVENGTDELSDWVKDSDHKKMLLLDEESEISKVQTVLEKYGDQLNESDLIKIGQDPFLIAAALDNVDRCIVTAELSKPGTKRANRKIPDVCDDCAVAWCSPVDFLNELDFTTGWENQ